LNNLKKKILIISGGISKERLISLDTGLQVAKELRKNLYKVKISEPNSNLQKIIIKFNPDVIFNALHGQFGEDGYIQTILERFKIPYTHSGVISSAIAMDKEISKKLFIKYKINTPKFFTYSFDKKSSQLVKLINSKLKFPVVVKPLNEGSSVNVFICNRKNIFKILESLKKYKKVMIEQFIGGREIQVAILGKKKLGAIELKPKRKFYDYKAKYNTNAKTQHIIKIDLPKNKLNEVLELAHKAHKIIKCKGVTRSDFKYFKGKFYLLEINTQPGMTKLSLVPEIAAHHGMSFIKLIEWILKDASTKR
jgi:D-alanine-D-alanine ligase